MKTVENFEPETFDNLKISQKRSWWSELPAWIALHAELTAENLAFPRVWL